MTDSPARSSALQRAVFPGEPGSFAEDAALAYFGEQAAIERLPDFRDVVEAVASGAFDQGIVPIENVVFGTVQQVQDLLAASDVTIVGEVIVPVRLRLVALPGQRLEDIERVYSHIQALGQAEAFLRGRDWSLLAATNTAGAGKIIGVGARPAPQRSSRHEPRSCSGWRCWPRISSPSHATGPASWCWRIPVRCRAVRPTLRQRCTPRSSCWCATSRARWYGCLTYSRMHGPNMTKLESRPSRTHTWEYVFWIDLDADMCAPEHLAGTRRPARRSARRAGDGLLPEGARAGLTTGVRGPGRAADRQSSEEARAMQPMLDGVPVVSLWPTVRRPAAARRDDDGFRPTTSRRCSPHRQLGSPGPCASGTT